MTLILTVRNSDALAGGHGPAIYRIDADLPCSAARAIATGTLPDPSNAISSRHCEIRREGEAWLLKDISTNGTFLNERAERIAGEHRIAEGDLIRIGHYELVASVRRGRGQDRSSCRRPRRAGTAARARAEPGTGSGRGRRGGAGRGPRQRHGDVGLARRHQQGRLGARRLRRQRDAAPARRASRDGRRAGPAPGRGRRGLGETEVERSPELVGKAGALLKRLVAGLLVMVEARARAKAQMGAEMTGLELEGNNPIKFARSPEQALAQLLSPPEPGFMEADRAVEDAFSTCSRTRWRP